MIKQNKALFILYITWIIWVQFHANKIKLNGEYALRQQISSFYSYLQFTSDSKIISLISFQQN